MIDLKKLMVFIIIVAVIGAIFLLGKMIGTINKTVKPEKIVYVKIESADLLSNPLENSIPLITIEKGDKLIFFEEKDGWMKVAYGSFTGYIKKEYISENPVSR